MFSRGIRGILVNFLLLTTMVCLGESPVVTWYANLMSQEEETLKSVFLNLTGMTEYDWQCTLARSRELCDQKDIDYQEILQHHESPLQTTISLVHSLLEEQNIDPASIKVMGNSYAASPFARKNIMAIAISYFNYLNATPAEIEAALLHEVMHLVYEDMVVHNCLRMIAKTLPWHIKVRVEPLLHRWKLFTEKRADIMAGLTNPSRAQALASLYTKLGQSNLYKEASTHPSLQERIQCMTDLYKNLEQGFVDKPSRLKKGISVLKNIWSHIKDFATKEANCL